MSHARHNAPCLLQKPAQIFHCTFFIRLCPTWLWTQPWAHLFQVLRFAYWNLREREGITTDAIPASSLVTSFAPLLSAYLHKNQIHAIDHVYTYTYQVRVCTQYRVSTISFWGPPVCVISSSRKHFAHAFGWSCACSWNKLIQAFRSTHWKQTHA